MGTVTADSGSFPSRESPCYVGHSATSKWHRGKASGRPSPWPQSQVKELGHSQQMTALLSQSCLEAGQGILSLLPRPLLLGHRHLRWGQ